MTSLLAILFIILAADVATACGTVTVGDLVISDAWSRTTIGADLPGVAYLTIRNDGANDDRLTGVSTPSATPMLHETRMRRGTISMSQTASIPIPTGTTIMLEPDGLHVTLVDLALPLKLGATFPMSLTFEKAGEVTVETHVMPFAAHVPDC